MTIVCDVAMHLPTLVTVSLQLHPSTALQLLLETLQSLLGNTSRSAYIRSPDLRQELVAT